MDRGVRRVLEHKGAPVGLPRAGCWLPKLDVISLLEQEEQLWAVDEGVPRGACSGEGRALQGWEEPIHPRGTLSPYLLSHSSEQIDYSVFQ